MQTLFLLNIFNRLNDLEYCVNQIIIETTCLPIFDIIHFMHILITKRKKDKKTKQKYRKKKKKEKKMAGRMQNDALVFQAFNTSST